MKRTGSVVLILLVLAAFAIRAIHLDWGFPEIYEEATPAREAVGFWGTPGSGLDLNPGFFKYPSLTFYLNFGVQATWYFWLSLSGQVDSLNDFRQLLAQEPVRAVQLGRWLDALLGALLVLPTFVLARRLSGVGAGWLAGAVVAVLPMAVVESQLVSPDPALALFAACGLAAATGIVTSGRRIDYLWCGLWVGLAASAKYPGAMLAVSLLTAHAIRAHARGEGLTGTLGSGLLWQALFIAGLAFVALSPYVLLDFSTAWGDLGFERRHMALGHLGREGGRAWRFYLGNALPAGWTWPILVGAGGGVGHLLVRRNTRAAALPGVAFAMILLAVMGSWKMAAPRYLLPLVPLGAAWSAVGVQGVARALGRGDRRAAAAAAVLAVGLLAWPAARVAREIAVRGRSDSRQAAAEWIARNVPEGSTLLVERYGPEPDPVRYQVLYLPFHGMNPHLYDAAYTPFLYSTFDYIVLSTGVSARYIAKPEEYPIQTNFYHVLEDGFAEVAAFSPGIYLGPEIRILKRREDVELVDLSRMPMRFLADQKGNSALAEYLSALGTVLVRQGHDDLGFRMLQEAVEMDGGNPKTWGNLGAMHLRLGQLEQAQAALRRAMELDPEDAEVLYNRGTLLARMGEPRQAVEAFQMALELRPELEDAYIGLARVLVESDRYPEARAVLSEFLRRFPRSSRRPAAEQAMYELSRLGSGRP